MMQGATGLTTRIMLVLAVTAIAGCAKQAGEGPKDGPIAITVTEKGFEPDVVTVPAGKPVTLVVTRETTKTCATELVMAEHGIKQDLPLGQAVEITFTPAKAGELRFACAMDMIGGKVIVR